jgi:hypothetical protein
VARGKNKNGSESGAKVKAAFILEIRVEELSSGIGLNFLVSGGVV